MIPRTWNAADLRSVTSYHRSLWRQLIGNGQTGVTIEGMLPGFALSLQLLFDQGYNLTDVGAMFGVTRERVRQWAKFYRCTRFPIRTPPRVWSDRQRCFIAIPEAASRREIAARRRRWEKRKRDKLNMTQERFWSLAAIGSDEECWLWQGKHLPHPREYGLFGAQYAHRLAYLWTYGAIAKPCIAHSCDVPSCVNPAHLWEATHAENTQDSVTKGRWSKSHQVPHRRRTHCKRGHLLAVTRNRWGSCNQCNSDRKKRNYRKRRGSGPAGGGPA